MNNEKVYLIHEEDYVKHINEKVMLYSFVQQLAHHIDRLKPTHANEAVQKTAKTYASIAEHLFDSWGIPKSYLVFEDRDDLAELMENELIEPEEAGYYACDCEGERCCDFCDNYSADNQEYECDEEDAQEFAEMMAAITSAIHGYLGDHVTVTINID